MIGLIAANCLAAVAGVLVLEGYRALRRRWLLKRLPLVHRRDPATAITGPEDGARYYHAILELDGQQRVLYQGRNAIHAKAAYYRSDLPGTISFWDGPTCRGRRKVGP